MMAKVLDLNTLVADPAIVVIGKRKFHISGVSVANTAKMLELADLSAGGDVSKVEIFNRQAEIMCTILNKDVTGEPITLDWFSAHFTMEQMKALIEFLTTELTEDSDPTKPGANLSVVPGEVAAGEVPAKGL